MCLDLSRSLLWESSRARNGRVIVEFKQHYPLARVGKSCNFISGLQRTRRSSIILNNEIQSLATTTFPRQKQNNICTSIMDAVLRTTSHFSWNSAGRANPVKSSPTSRRRHCFTLSVLYRASPVNQTWESVRLLSRKERKIVCMEWKISERNYVNTAPLSQSVLP